MMTFGDDYGGVLGDFGMLLRAVGGLGSGSKSRVFVMDYKGGSRIQSTPPMQGEASVWEA